MESSSSSSIPSSGRKSSSLRPGPQRGGDRRRWWWCWPDFPAPGGDRLLEGLRLGLRGWRGEEDSREFLGACEGRKCVWGVGIGWRGAGGRALAGINGEGYGGVGIRETAVKERVWCQLEITRVVFFCVDYAVWLHLCE